MCEWNVHLIDRDRRMQGVYVLCGTVRAARQYHFRASRVQILRIREIHVRPRHDELHRVNMWSWHIWGDGGDLGSSSGM